MQQSDVVIAGRRRLGSALVATVLAAGLIASPALAVGSSAPVIVSPGSAQTVGDNFVGPYTVNFSDSPFGDYMVEVTRTDTGESDVVAGLDYTEASEPVQSFSVDTLPLTSGLYTVAVYNDPNSPVPVTASHDFTVADATPPVVATAPSPPRGLRTTTVSGAATLIWAYPASTGGAAIDRYQVKRGTLARNVPALSRRFTFTGLRSGSLYDLYVRAHNSEGFSRWARARVRVANPGVCAGIARCLVRSHADVNGDGRRDRVGLASRGSGANRSVIVRVKTGPGRIVSTRWRAPFWYGPLWQGAAHLDGRKGAEVVVGYTAGAHSLLFRSLTWRAGRLVTLDAPGRSGFWYVDGAVWISVGWQRPAGTPVGTIRHLSAVRTGDATQSPFKGTISTYRWAENRWLRSSSRTIPRVSDQRAYSWGGFHIPGLARW